MTSFAFFADTVAPAWRSAWKYDKELALACCAWFDFSAATMSRLRECDDEVLTWLALELKTWDQAKVATFVEALSPPDLLDAAGRPLVNEPPGLVNEGKTQAWQATCVRFA